MKTKEQVKTTDLRLFLKELMQREFEALPELLEQLEPKERINVMCKLVPFVLPKVEAVTHLQGEPDEFKIQQWH
jgi:hypothetical protein